MVSTNDWQFIPLSPDALSGFTKEEQDRKDRNQEVGHVLLSPVTHQWLAVVHSLEKLSMYSV